MLTINIKIQLIFVGGDGLFTFLTILTILDRNFHFLKQKSKQSNFRSAKVLLASFKQEWFFLGRRAYRGLKVLIKNINIQLIFVGGDDLFTFQPS